MGEGREEAAGRAGRGRGKEGKVKFLLLRLGDKPVWRVRGRIKGTDRS